MIEASRQLLLITDKNFNILKKDDEIEVESIFNFKLSGTVVDYWSNGQILYQEKSNETKHLIKVCGPNNSGTKIYVYKDVVIASELDGIVAYQLSLFD